MSVSRRGPGLEEVLRRMQAAAVTVGIHRSAGSNDGVSVAEYAAYNEFGTDNIPERSFLRSTMDETNRANKEILGKIVNNAITGREDVRTGMGKLGRKAQQDVQAKIVAIRTPGNAESTKAQKSGADNPLIDTGQMLQSVRWAHEGEEPR